MSARCTHVNCITNGQGGSISDRITEPGHSALLHNSWEGGEQLDLRLCPQWHRHQQIRQFEHQEVRQCVLHSQHASPRVSKGIEATIPFEEIGDMFEFVHERIKGTKCGGLGIKIGGAAVASLVVGDGGWVEERATGRNRSWVCVKDVPGLVLRALGA